MGPFDRFNDRAKRVLALAQDEAIRFNHNYIGTEHLLLGLVREGEGIAAGVLESLGVSLEKVRTQVIQVLNSNASYQGVVVPKAYPIGAAAPLCAAQYESRVVLLVSGGVYASAATSVAATPAA